MAHWSYYDSDGKKQGAFGTEQIKYLAQQGTITPETIIQAESGQTLPAGKIKGLVFIETALPTISPSQNATAVPIEESGKSSWKITLIGAVCLLVVSGIGWAIISAFPPKPVNNIQNVLEDHAPVVQANNEQVQPDLPVVMPSDEIVQNLGLSPEDIDLAIETVNQTYDRIMESAKYIETYGKFNNPQVNVELRKIDASTQALYEELVKAENLLFTIRAQNDSVQELKKTIALIEKLLTSMRIEQSKIDTDYEIRIMDCVRRNVPPGTFVEMSGKSQDIFRNWYMDAYRRIPMNNITKEHIEADYSADIEYNESVHVLIITFQGKHIGQFLDKKIPRGLGKNAMQRMLAIYKERLAAVQ
jgi:hypothetical protein